MTDAELLGEIEDILRTMPPTPALRDRTPKILSWFGRVVATIGLWDPVKAEMARRYITEYHTAPYQTTGFVNLMVLLHEARNNLRMRTLGPINSALGQGLVFDYFDEIRKLVESARSDILFVDPYLDSEFVSRYLPHVHSGVSIRLLAREKLATLIPAVALFAQQSRASIQVRSAPGFHDRYVIMDGSSCYQSGASFKDGGRNAPTTITQITDAFPAVKQTYETLWGSGKPGS